MKKTNKKGFTLVELVIVIAVIAILAGVLIGTFASVISRANQNKALQEWKARIDEAYVEYVADNHKTPTFVKINTTDKTVVFGENDGAVSLNLYTQNTTDNTKYDADKATDLFFTLDTTNKVYLLWNNATNESTYSVVATNATIGNVASALYKGTKGTTDVAYTVASDYHQLTYDGNNYWGN